MNHVSLEVYVSFASQSFPCHTGVGRREWDGAPIAGLPGRGAPVPRGVRDGGGAVSPRDRVGEACLD
jgi:hypothetical protein